MTIKTMLAKAGASFDNPVKWAIRLSLFAAVIAIWVKSGGPTSGYEQILFALSIGMAALTFEYIAAKKAANGWIDRSPGALFGWGLIWAGAFLYSANNWLGVAAEGESAKATAQKAAFVSYDDGRQALEAARARVKSEEASLAQLKAMTWQELPKIKGKPVMSADAAKAIMEASKEGTGTHTQAKAAFADLTERAAWQTKVEKAEAQLADARAKLAEAASKVSTTKVTTSTQRADLRVFVKYAKMDEETAEDVQSWLKIGVISLFVSLAAIMGVFESRQNEPRRPWFRWRTAIATVRSAWDGKGIERVEVHKTHIVNRPSGHQIAYSHTGA